MLAISIPASAIRTRDQKLKNHALQKRLLSALPADLKEHLSSSALPADLSPKPPLARRFHLREERRPIFPR